jgi:cupin fold WbuC family metalloprotein
MSKVIFSKSKVISINPEVIKRLKRQANKSLDGKARLCLHGDLDSSLQEMVIVHSRNVYVKPHKHTRKDESISIIEGRCFLVIFDKKGNIKKKVLLGQKPQDDNFICRISKDVWHSMVILSDFIVFHEVSSGPFTGKDDSIFPSWAPEKDNQNEINKFTRNILSIKSR